MRSLILCLAAAPALAFVPTAPLSTPTQNTVAVTARAPRQTRLARNMGCPTCMSAEGQFSLSGAARALAGAVAVGSAFLPFASFAAVGDSPKVSVFGIGGDAASSPFVTDVQTYSPYSPYSPSGKDTLYKQLNPEEVARAKAKFAESEKRVSRIPQYIENKLWSEVEGELDRQMYDTRASMLKLATGKPGAEKAAKSFFEDIETINTAAQRKQGDVAKVAYEKAAADLKAFKSAI